MKPAIKDIWKVRYDCGRWTILEVNGKKPEFSYGTLNLLIYMNKLIKSV